MNTISIIGRATWQPPSAPERQARSHIEVISRNPAKAQALADRSARSHRATFGRNTARDIVIVAIQYTETVSAVGNTVRHSPARDSLTSPTVQRRRQRTQ